MKHVKMIQIVVIFALAVTALNLLAIVTAANYYFANGQPWMLHPLVVAVMLTATDIFVAWFFTKFIYHSLG